MKDKLFKKENTTIIKTILTVLALSIVMVAFQTAFQHDKQIYKCFVYFTNPDLIILNLIPVFLIMLIFTFMFKRINVGFMVTAVPLFLMLVVNKYKIYFRDEPLIPLDFSLLNEATNIIQNYNLLTFKPVIIIAIVVFILICRWVIKNYKKIDVEFPKQIIVILIGVFLCFFAYFDTYSSKDVYDSLVEETGMYHDTEITTRLGFTYSFIAKIKAVNYEEPEGYSDDKAKEILSRYSSGNNLTEFPNVIAIMSEAFFDAQGAENVKFDDNLNPYAKLNSLREESYYGNIIVPGFGGSTASTEFEFLTGNNISLIDSSMPVVYKTHINHKVYSLASFFKELGFMNSAVHLHHKWFYNRQNVYPRMGFDEFVSVEDYDRPLDKVNNYVSDVETTNAIIESYERHLSTYPDKGYFNFTVTIQNHGPYDPNYTESYRRLIRPDGLDDEKYNIVSNYFNGVYDAVEQLDVLKTYLEEMDVPTILVFFGDHLAYFDDELLTYQILGYDFESGGLESMYAKYAIPYVIWANDSAREFIKERGGEFKMGDGGEISSNYLASQMFECVDLGMPPFFEFVNEVKKNLNCVKGNYYVGDNNMLDSIPKKYDDLLNEYEILQYYNLKRFGRK